MCLAVPGKIVHWIDRDPVFAQAEVEFGGVRRRCHMACVTEAAEGDYVIVHAGVAISRIDEASAQRVLNEFAALDQSLADEEEAPREVS